MPRRTRRRYPLLLVVAFEGETIRRGVEYAVNALVQQYGRPRGELVVLMTRVNFDAMRASAFGPTGTGRVLANEYEMTYRCSAGTAMMRGDDLMARDDRVVAFDPIGDDGALCPPLASVDLATMEAAMRSMGPSIPRFDPIAEITMATTKAAATETRAQFASRMKTLRRGKPKLAPQRIVGLDFGHGESEGAIVTGMYRDGVLTIDEARRLTGIEELKEATARYGHFAEAKKKLFESKHGSLSLSLERGTGEVAIVPHKPARAPSYRDPAFVPEKTFPPTHEDFERIRLGPGVPAPKPVLLRDKIARLLGYNNAQLKALAKKDTDGDD